MNRSKITNKFLCILFSVILSISVSAAPVSLGEAPQNVYVGGMPFGIRFQVGEVSVIKKNSFISEGKTVSPADEAGILENDVITQVGTAKIETVNDFISAVDTKSGSPIDLTVKRGEKEFTATLTPQRSDETGEYMLGILLKDSSAGIGTVTYIAEDSFVFAGLGHGICDSNTGEILPIENGYISRVKINGITKGTCGSPGELRGILETEKCGKLLSNTEVGVYGVFTDSQKIAERKICVAKADEIKTGSATILCTLDDNKCGEYAIEISEIDHSAAAKTKNYVIKVTDERLIEKTGGIVQGMSGSPILQNGKLIGAVTHVFVNDPTRGYGIFIENMLSEAEETE